MLRLSNESLEQSVGLLHVELEIEAQPVSVQVSMRVGHPLVQDQRWDGYEAAIADLRAWANADPMIVPLDKMPLLNAARAMGRHLLHEPKTVVTTATDAD